MNYNQWKLVNHIEKMNKHQKALSISKKKNELQSGYDRKSDVSNELQSYYQVHQSDTMNYNQIT